MTTQYASASYQEIIDLHTESDKVSVVGIHTPNSDTPYHMLKGFWTQFKKFKYNGCSISLVPAARLPADPLQVSYEPGETTIDPRDMLNPILFHGCHGDDMGAILNSLYALDSSSSFIDEISSDSADLNVFPQSLFPGDSAVDVYEALYYKALVDKTWLKAHPQVGFRKNGLHPMVYSVAAMHQIAGIDTNFGDLGALDTVHTSAGVSQSVHGSVGGTGPSNDATYIYGPMGRPVADVVNNKFTLPRGHSLGLVTPRLQKLGWMDTRNVLGSTSPISVEQVGTTADMLGYLYKQASEVMDPVLVPKIYMGMIMLPPAYKTEQYYRLIINHSFSFAKFRGASFQYDPRGMIQKAYSVFDFNNPDAVNDSKLRVDDAVKNTEVVDDDSEV